MNDPGLEGPVGEAVDDLQLSRGQSDGQCDQDMEQDKTLLDPSRWWYASTAFPLIAGTFGPMANAFNICSVASPWREYIPPGFGEYNSSSIPDTKWLIAINAVSLGLALIANLSLLLNMAGRVSFAVAQPSTIAGFFTSSLILIALIIVANTSAFQLTPSSEHALTQAYYYAIFAASIYFILAFLMSLTVLGAVTGKYEKKFNLTISQRTLMLQTMTFFFYLLIGALVFSYTEGWIYLDAVYFAEFSLLTIGTGDITPSSHLGRSLLIPYILGGILAVGLIIGSIRTMILEKSAAKMHARIMEKKREKIKTVAELGTKEKVGMKLRPDRYVKTQPNLPEEERRRREFYAMREIKETAHRERQWMALGMSTFGAVVLWFVGAVVFWRSEQKQGWSYFDAIYFSFVTLITLGYGDLVTVSNSGKAFYVFWTLLAVPTLTILVSDMGGTVIKGIADLTNWLGSFTVLPGKTNVLEVLKDNLVKSPRKLLKTEDCSGEKHPSDELCRDHPEAKGRFGTVVEMLKWRLTDDDTCLAEEHARTSGHSLDPDTRFYHFLLTKEINTVLNDTRSSPPKKYTYDEWAYFLKLLDHDEGNTEHHGSPGGKPKWHNDTGPQVGRIHDDDGNVLEWSWLGIRSPLLSHKHEAEWILCELLLKLNRDLSKLGLVGDKKKPPIVLAMIFDNPSDLAPGVDPEEPHATGSCAHPHEEIGQGGESQENQRAAFPAVGAAGSGMESGDREDSS